MTLHIADCAEVICPWCHERLANLKPSGGCLIAEVSGAAWHPVCADVYDEIDPEVRPFVMQLRLIGFDTSDSGDGHSKPKDWYESGEAMPMMNIATFLADTTSPADFFLQAHLMQTALGNEWQVQASYSTVDCKMVLLATRDRREPS